jgi:Putative redox-active protein (C_GCAxxG_C_C)
MEEFPERSCGSIPKVASGFGGGIGASKSETCGALTADIIVLGCLFGRNTEIEVTKSHRPKVNINSGPIDRYLNF